MFGHYKIRNIAIFYENIYEKIIRKNLKYIFLEKVLYVIRPFYIERIQLWTIRASLLVCKNQRDNATHCDAFLLVEK